MPNLCTYLFIMAIAAILSATLSARMSWVMAKRYGFKDENRNWMCWLTGIGSAIVMIVTSQYVMSNYGMKGGLALDVLSLPISGIIWLLIVGANKAVERLVNGVDVTLSANSDSSK